jgi:hypothetical protein
MHTAYLAVEKEPTDIFNYCTKYLIRERSNENADQDTITEGWRFPLVMAVLHEEQPIEGQDIPIGTEQVKANNYTGKYNEVVFIFYDKHQEVNDKIEIIGSFLPMYDSRELIPLEYKGDFSGIYYLALKLPIGNGFYYRYRIKGKDILDPINPQRTTLQNGRQWSFFFTDYYNYSHLFEEWEINLLYRLVEQITPFRTKESQNFINRFYEGLSQRDKQLMKIYKLDESVGEVNYITNILAREERHHLNDYKTCLKLIDKLLGKRNPYIESWKVSRELIDELYNDFVKNEKGTLIPDWDYTQYQNPTYFLKTLRRHCIVGAFSHPRYGGNIGGAGWDFVKDRFNIKDTSGKVIGSYFNWDLAIERPLGQNPYYRG